MAYQNLSGTTCKSFKIGPNGVALSSVAIQNEQGKKIVSRYLATNVPVKDENGATQNRTYEVAYTDPKDRYSYDELNNEFIEDAEGNMTPLYDTVINTNDVAAISVIKPEQLNGIDYPRVQITLKKEWAPGMGKSIILYTYMEAGTGNVNGPNAATDGAIVLFDGASGKVIKDSGRIIVDNMQFGVDLSHNRNIPSEQAVYKYLGLLSDPLFQTLAGTNDSNYN